MGEALIDLIHGPDDDDPVAQVGGSPFNVAIAMARLGLDVGFICPISRDEFGDKLVEVLRREKIRQCIRERASAPTAIAEVTTDAHGHPSYRFHRDQTADRAMDAHPPVEAIPDEVEALHFGSLVLAQKGDWPAWRAAVTKARDRGAFIALDVNVRPALIDDLEDHRRRVQEAAELAHLIKASDEDLMHLFPETPPEDALKRWCRPSTVVVLTRGAEGCQLWTCDDTAASYRSQERVQIVDTVGAGDTFQAALIAGFLGRGGTVAELKQPEATELLRYAATSALLNCSRAGCQPPSREEVAQLLESKPPARSPIPSEKGVDQ